MSEDVESLKRLAMDDCLQSLKKLGYIYLEQKYRKETLKKREAFKYFRIASNE